MKAKPCPECGCVMKCVAWFTDSNEGKETIGHGDFDCRNCDHTEQNTNDPVFSFTLYSSTAYDDTPADMPFEDFLEQHQDDLREWLPHEKNEAEELLDELLN